MSANEDYLGECAEALGSKDGSTMTESQRSLVAYFGHLKRESPDCFGESSRVKFSDLFKFRGLLGSGSYGVVMIVQDKFTKFQSFDQENLSEETTALKIISKQRLSSD
jgi:hypothetical protein